MSEQNGSKKWMIFVRTLWIAIGIIQMGIIGWAKFITIEVIENKSASAAMKIELRDIKEDVIYIRDRMDERWRK